MLLKEIGEFGFIDRISEKFKGFSIRNAVGIGDDCAVLPINHKYANVVTTDMLVENVHFIRSKITPFELGYKTLAVNLSDVAAMGAKPIASFLSIAIPPSIDVEYLDKFFEGYNSLCKKYDVSLLGGDTTRSENNLILNVTVIGRIYQNKARLRCMAKSGDIICVTGYLGDSAGGLKVLLENIPLSENEEYLIKCHNIPEPCVNEGIWLANQKGVNAMIDISDGIVSDLKHILKASKKSAIVDIQKIPISKQLKIVANNNHFNIIEFATSGGEDYQLLFTINEKDFTKISNKFFNKFKKELYSIGKIEDETNETILWLKDDVPVDDIKEGFNHFI